MEPDIEIVARIVVTCDVIQNIPGSAENLVRRYHACIEVGGRQFD